jgi:iron-sulfur cluster assembly protein
MDNLSVVLNSRATLLERLLEEGVAIAHDCGGKLACSSCRVVVRSGSDGLEPPGEDELDMLDRAGGAAAGARLACQVRGPGELVVEIPRSEAPARALMRPLTVSARAARHFASQLEKHPGAVGVRLSVEPSGCSGYGYRIDPAESIESNDAVFDAAGVRVVVDRVSLPFLEGTLIDVEQLGLARRLRFENPNARQTCGCGESFGVA